jgi:hypothetical protein
LAPGGRLLREFALSGYTNWRLATIDELVGIYDKAQNVNGYHIKGGIRLSSIFTWSSSRNINASEMAWYFSFYDGLRDSSRLDFKSLGRALCVRPSGK